MMDNTHTLDKSLAIPQDTPLKHLLGEEAVWRLALSIMRVHPDFDADAFRRKALHGLEPLELMERAQHVARALRAHLPPHHAAVEILLASMAPPSARAGDNDLDAFIYLPYVCFVAEYGQAAREET